MSTARSKSKPVATWAALLLGGMGVHRFYLHGLGDAWAWAHITPTLLGLHGVQRAQQYGLDDRLSWLLIPLLGLSLSASMLTAIVYGLTSDEHWRERHDPEGRAWRSGWFSVIGVVLALGVGAAVLMSTIAVSVQRYFEYRAAPAAPAAAAARSLRETAPG